MDPFTTAYERGEVPEWVNCLWHDATDCELVTNCCRVIEQDHDELECCKTWIEDGAPEIP